MSTDNRSILQAANGHVSVGDNEGFLSYCTEDVVWHFVGDQTLTGKQAVRQYMTETYIEPPKFDIENTIAEGDFVTAIGKINLKGKNGKLINYAYCDVWRFENGKMAELKAFVIPQ